MLLDLDDRGLGEDELYYVLVHGDDEMLERVLKAGVDPNARTEYGPMMFEARRPGQMRLLLAHGANPRPVWQKWTPLMSACKNGDAERARMLLEAGADTKQKNKAGKTAHDIAKVHPDLSKDRALLKLLQGKSRPVKTSKPPGQPARVGVGSAWRHLVPSGKPMARARIDAFELTQHIALPTALRELLLEAGPIALPYLSIGLPKKSALPQARKKSPPTAAHAKLKRVAPSKVPRNFCDGTLVLGTRNYDDAEYLLIMNGACEGQVWVDLEAAELGLRLVAPLARFVVRALTGDLDDGDEGE